MIEETFYLYKDNNTGFYLQYVYEAGMPSHLYLIKDIREATKIKDLNNNNIIKSLKWNNSSMQIYIQYPLSKFVNQSELEIVIEKYCTQTIFLSSKPF